MSRHCLHRLRRAVRRWLGCPEFRVSVTGFDFEFRDILIDRRSFMASTLRDGKALCIKFAATDADGFEVPLPAPAVFTADGQSLVRIVAGPDAGTAYVVPMKPFQLVTVRVTGSVPGHPELGSLEYTINLAAGDPKRLKGDVEVIDESGVPTSTDAPAEPKATDEHQVVS